MSHDFPHHVDKTEVQRIDAYLEEHRHLRQGNKVLHGCPSPLLWRRRDVPVAEIMALRKRTATTVPKRLIVYVATPYCLPTDPDGAALIQSLLARERTEPRVA